MKSGFQFDKLENIVILPKIFLGYPEIRSGMSTKLGSSNQTDFDVNLSNNIGDDPAIVEMNRISFLSSLGISVNELANPHQSHSANVRKADVPAEYEDCDALITKVSGVALAIIVADCVPIHLFDPINKAIGAVHAGWRGTANGIVKRTAERMHEEFNTNAKDILAFIGPSSGVCCYEVNADVAVKFENKIVTYNGSKIFIDLKKENAFQLKQMGVPANNLEISRHCTICEKQLFHSYRRDGTRAGRMMAVICLEP